MPHATFIVQHLAVSYADSYYGPVVDGNISPFALPKHMLIAFARSLHHRRKQLPRWVARLTGWLRARFLHSVVRESGGATASGFAVFGNTRWESRFITDYLGDDAQTRRDLRPHGVTWHNAAQALSRELGLVIVADVRIPRALAPHLLRIPAFVAMRVDLAGTDDEFLKALPRSARSDISRTSKRGFTFDVVQDASWAQEYHDRFHRPSVSRRHGDEGFVMRPEEMVRWIEAGRGEFVRLYHEGQIVGGLLNERRGDVYHLQRLGWRDGSVEWTRLGVVPAMEWFSIRRARSLGCSAIQFGGTPPIVENGVFQFKSKWGARMDAANTTFAEYSVLLDVRHADVKRLLASHSLVVFDADGGFAVVSGRTPHDTRISPATEASVTRWYTLREAPLDHTENPDDPRCRDLPPALRGWFDIAPREL